MILWVVCYSKNVQTMFDRSQVSKDIVDNYPDVDFDNVMVKLNHCCLHLIKSELTFF